MAPNRDDIAVFEGMVRALPVSLLLWGLILWATL